MPKSRGNPERGGRTAHDQALIDLLLLRALPGIGDLRGRELIERYGSAGAALHAPASALGAEAAAARGSRQTHGWVETALRTIDEHDIQVIPYYDARYPACLAPLHDPPLVLFARGSLALIDSITLAVVGTRSATEYGCDAARTLAGAAARAGVVIVSGLARGIDGAAHEAALEYGGGTIAVLGAGIDVAYPREHARLQEQIGRDGLLVSEFLPGTPVQGGQFVRRNRIIAALARAVLVIEAPVNSGALNTVRHALELGVDVLAVPGPIGRPSCAGTNQLLLDGATMVIDPRDVFDALGMVPPDEPAAQDDAQNPAAELVRRRRALKPARTSNLRWALKPKNAAAIDASRRQAPPDPPPVDPQAAAVWHVLGPDSLHIDVIAARARLPAPQAAATLLQLELEGRARKSAGMMYRRAR